ncbi:hypothetical protein MF672_039025 [Actinomadura sp. ATCC 31491]|uniref:Uncharacterized protein n=1 Tax=Actinomadura luzonensis TaxID=2805427 RepID=A0ABT0G6M2_9ACTN|nr:hypothetical protein [Actinomadura luzonensis]MCK2219748.1 hypothetical protein [Actinomadura luzonensis]
MHPYYEDAARRAFHEEVADVEPRYVLPQILTGARRREAWLLALTATIGALLILAGLLLLTWGQEQPPAAPKTISTRPWEA